MALLDGEEHQLAEESAPQSSLKWHELHKWLIPLVLAIGIIVGGAIAPRLANFVGIGGGAINSFTLVIDLFCILCLDLLFSLPLRTSNPT